MRYVTKTVNYHKPNQFVACKYIDCHVLPLLTGLHVPLLTEAEKE